MIIGLLGSLINNENMGCVALTFSLINMLEKIAKEKKEDYRYYIFEVAPNEACRQHAIKILQLQENQIKCFDVTSLYRARRFVHHFFNSIVSLNALNQCDYVIDLTAGDSFTDIYGQYTFDGETNVKLLTKRLGKKLILGPQTYGPFSTDKNIQKAKKTTEGLGLQMADCGILVNGIAPGVVKTKMQAFSMKQGNNMYCNQNPLFRVALPEEIAELTVFMMSDSCNFMTGQTILVDGGFTLN